VEREPELEKGSFARLHEQLWTHHLVMATFAPKSICACGDGAEAKWGNNGMERAWTEAVEAGLCGEGRRRGVEAREVVVA
jgi:hypothetical protein